MAAFSFDIVSQYDKAEMNNVFMQTEKEIINRYDFKGTPAAIEWLPDRKGLKTTAAHDMQLESILDIIRNKLAARDQSSKTLDLTKLPVASNMKISKEIPFKDGLNQDNAKQITKLLKDKMPKVKAQIQGDTVRVTSNSKDELQTTMQVLRQQDYDFPLNFINYR